MRHDLWDIMMYRLLQEKKEKEVRAEKSKKAKPDFLDLDKDGDKSEPMKKALKGKKGKDKTPSKLKSKVDEEIERLEKILFEELADSTVQTGRNPLEEEEIYSQEKRDELSYGDVGSDEDSFYSFRKHGKKCDCDCHDEDEDFVKTDFEAEELEEDVEYLSEAEVKKKKPKLNKVVRNPAGSNKKFHVYVRCGGKIKKISFGDPGLSIKRDSDSRRKNFRARHKCDKPEGKNRCSARYWACKTWERKKTVTDIVKGKE